MTDLSDLKALKLKVKKLKAVMQQTSGEKKQRIRKQLKLAQVKYRKLYMKIYSKNYYRHTPQTVIKAVTKYKKTPKGIRSRKKYEETRLAKARSKRYEQTEKGYSRQKKYRDSKKQ